MNQEQKLVCFVLSYLHSVSEFDAVNRRRPCSLLVVAVYKPYDVATQLLYPWLIFYGAVGIPALVTASILLAVNLGNILDIP